MIKKILKIVGISIAVIFLLLLILPYAFKGQIVEKVKTEINKNLEAKVEFGPFKLSLIRNFPNATLVLNKLKITGVEPFAEDTLLAIDRTSLTINLFSFIREEGFEIKSISLNRADLLLKTLKDGTANWNIFKETEEEIENEEALLLHLKNARISRANFFYLDDESEIYISAKDINGVLRGDLSMDITDIYTRNTTIGSFSLRYGQMPILSNITGKITAAVEANLVDYVFTFRDNELLLNELPVSFDGLIALPDDDIVMDFSFSALQSQFKNFLSIIPVVYTRDFKALMTSGNMDLRGFVKGTYNDLEIPGFGLNIEVQDGMFRYPKLPTSVSNVQLKLDIQNPGKDPDLTIVDMPQLTMNLAGNPFEARLNLKTLISDPQIDALLIGRLDLGKVESFLPIETGTAMKGFIDSDLKAKGRLSSIENGRYNEFFAQGHFKINDLTYVTEDLPQTLNVARAEFLLSPRFISVPVFSMKLGDSDLNASGKIDNLLGFMLDNQLLKGSFETRSSFFNLNQLMENIPDDSTDEPMELSVIKVPANIDFTLHSYFDRLNFCNLEITNTRGTIRLAEEKAVLHDLRMDLLGGGLVLNGTYNTAGTLPMVDFGLEIIQFDIQESFKAFNTLEVLAPVGEYAHGSFSAKLGLKSQLDNFLRPVLESLAGSGSLNSPALSVQGSPAMSRLADLTKIEAFRMISLRDLNLSFAFEEGRVDVEPFDLRFGQSKATVRGSNFFDGKISYVMNVELPREQFGGVANQVLDNLENQAAGKGLAITPRQIVDLDVIIGGSFTDPEVSFGLSGVMDDVKSQLRDQIEQQLQDEAGKVRDEIEDRVQETVDEARQKIQAELNARADQIMQQANQQADKVRDETMAAAEKIRQEARRHAQRLENEASGAIAKAAARKAGEALIKEADKKAAQLGAEGERNATRIVNEARQRADRIRSGEQE